MSLDEDDGFVGGHGRKSPTTSAATLGDGWGCGTLFNPIDCRFLNVFGGFKHFGGIWFVIGRDFKGEIGADEFGVGQIAEHVEGSLMLFSTFFDIFFLLEPNGESVGLFLGGFVSLVKLLFPGDPSSEDLFQRLILLSDGGVALTDQKNSQKG